MHTDSFIVYLKIDIYKDIAEDIETRFDTLNYELECNSIEILLPKGKNQKVIGLMKYENKRQKKCVIKSKLKIKNDKNCLKAAQIENKINYLEKNKIDINSNKVLNQTKIINQH